MNTPILDFLLENADAHYASFHMPGHKGPELYREFGFDKLLEKAMECDVTEIIGADNLFKAEGIIKDAQERYAGLYGARKSYLLVNGTSGGLIAGILSCVPRGGSLIMARNCHKSVFNALGLGDIRPVYVYPEILEEYGVTGEVKASEIAQQMDEHPEASAVILPSPNYYGVCSDIKAIAEVVHSRGKILIVDQAHGAHLKFFGGSPKAAEDCGADLVVNSVHKTLAAFTQSAVLNLCSDRVSAMLLEDRLQAIESSSPSYLLMAGLDINASLLLEHGPELMQPWSENLDYAYERLGKIRGLRLMRDGLFDRTKINLDMSELGLSGGELELLLLKKGIRAELTTGNILMCMTGIGNTREDFKKLADALEEIAVECDDSPIANKRYDAKLQSYRGLEMGRVPAEKEVIPLSEGAGRICASSIIPYPPGIPLACPGEKLTADLVNYVAELIACNEKVIGVSLDQKIIVGK